MKWLVAAGIPLAYLLGVIWAMRPARPEYVRPGKIVVNVRDAGGPAVLPAPAPLYPEIARQKRIEGSVKLHVKVDGEGRVAEIGIVSGPEELAQAAIDAV